MLNFLGVRTMQTNLSTNGKNNKHFIKSTVTNDKLVAKVYSKGMVRIPVSIRNDMHIHDGDEVVFLKHGTTWTISTREKMLADAQHYFKQFKKDEQSLVDELIAERRKEAEMEFSK